MYPGINEDGSLKKFSTPIPSSTAAKAASTGDVETLQTLSKSEIVATDEHGNTALIWAANSGQTNVLEYILNLGVLANETATQSEHSDYLNHKGYLGNTALSRAARGGHVECVRLLISQDKIDPNMCNEKMQFPLHFGAFKKHIDVVKVLLESGKCDTFVKDRKGRTPAEDTRVQEIKDLIISYRNKQ